MMVMVRFVIKMWDLFARPTYSTEFHRHHAVFIVVQQYSEIYLGKKKTFHEI